MKAKEIASTYTDVLRSLIKEGDQENYNKKVEEIFTLFKDELSELIKTRKIILRSNLDTAIKEVNAKWNALCREVEKQFGFKVFNENAFKNFAMELFDKSNLYN